MAGESQNPIGPREIDRVTVVAEGLDPQRDLSALAGLGLINALHGLGVEVEGVCAACPAWACPRGVRVERGIGLPSPAAGLWVWRRRARAAVAQAIKQDRAVLSLTPLVRGDVTLLLDGTEHQRITAQADPTRRVLALAKPVNQLRVRAERRALSGGVTTARGAADGPLGACVAVLGQAAAAEVSVLRDPAASEPVVLPYAVDVDASQGEAAQTRRQRRVLRRGLGVTETMSVLLFPAVRPLRHGFGPLMLALRELVDRKQAVVVLLAGQYRYTHLSWLAELGLREHVRFVGPTRRLDALYAAADVVAHPTGYDPGGEAVLRALAAGRPAVTTSACGAAALIGSEGVSAGGAVLDPLASPKTLAQALESALAAAQAGVGHGALGDWDGVCHPLDQARTVLAMLAEAKRGPALALPGESD